MFHPNWRQCHQMKSENNPEEQVLAHDQHVHTLEVCRMVGGNNVSWRVYSWERNNQEQMVCSWEVCMDQVVRNKREHCVFYQDLDIWEYLPTKV